MKIFSREGTIEIASLSFLDAIFLLHEDSLFEKSSIVSQGLRNIKDTHISFIQYVSRKL
jgi:hypothetical protein